MPLTYYNPADGGLCAKIYEALRRNPQFLTKLKTERAVKGPNRGPSWEVAGNLTEVFDLVGPRPRGFGSCHQILVTHQYQNPFAALMLRWLLPISADGRPETPRLDEALAWPDTPLAFRKAFEFVMKRHRRPLAPHKPETESAPAVGTVPRAPIEIIGQLATLDGQKRATEFIATIHLLQGENDLLAVPSPRDKGHRHEILADLAKRIRVPSLTARDVSRNGKTLGTRMEWETFLVYDLFLLMKYTERQALHRAATEIFGSDKHPPKWSKEKKAAEDYRKNQSHIHRRIDAIKAVIDQVYPDFSAFGPRPNLPLSEAS